VTSWRSRLYELGSAFVIANMAVSSPRTEPDLARMVSATTGFFFWGIMLLVALYSSAISTKPNSRSSRVSAPPPSGWRSTIAIAAAEALSSAKSLRGHGIHGVPHESAEPEERGDVKVPVRP